MLLVKGSEGGALVGVRFQGFEWEVLECSFTLQELTEPGGLLLVPEWRLRTTRQDCRLIDIKNYTICMHYNR